MHLYLHGGIYADLDVTPVNIIRFWQHYPFDDIGIVIAPEEDYFA